MISFAGEQLVIDDKHRSLEQYLESAGHNLPLQWPQGDYPAPVLLNFPPAPEVGLNQLVWPTGFNRPAIGRFLITKQNYEVINTLTDSGDLIFTTYEGEELKLEMWVISIDPIAVLNANESLYVLTLGDERWRVWNRNHNATNLSNQTIQGAIDAIGGLEYVALPALNPVFGSLSTKWAGFPPLTPAPLILEAVANSIGRRWVYDLDYTRASLMTLTQTADDELWDSIKDRVRSGGRLTDAQVRAGLPTNYVFKFLNGGSTTKTLSELLGTTTIGSGETVGIICDRDTVSTEYAQTLGRDWIGHHLSGIDCTVNGIFPLTLHPGIDSVILTHRRDLCNMRIVRWGKTFHPGFTYGTQQADVNGRVGPAVAALRGFNCDVTGNVVIDAVVDWFIMASPITLKGRVVKESNPSLGEAGVTVQVEVYQYGNEPPLTYNTVTGATGDYSIIVSQPPTDGDRKIIVKPLGGTFVPADYTVAIPADLTTTVPDFIKNGV